MGSYTDWTGSHGFVRARDGTITSFDIPRSMVAPFAMNAKGTITGRYQDESLVYHGFLRTRDGNITTFDPPGSLDTNPVSINSAGVIAGSYYDTALHGFLRAPNGTITSFEPPEGCGEFGWISINSEGAIAGSYLDRRAYPEIVWRSFVRTRDGAIITFNAPDSPWTEAVSINPQGTVTGFYIRSGTPYVRHGFVMNMRPAKK
jgi:hypothetical protein